MAIGATGTARTVLRTVLAIALGVATIALVVLSPLLMRPMLHGGTDWQRLGWVGDTYGGVAAIASGIALVGVAGSLVLQRRQSRVEREYAFREYHREMLRMSMDDPALAACWGPRRDTGLATDVDLYVTLMIGYWHAGWQVGAFNEQRLRLSLRRFFAGEVGRRCWREQDEERMIGRSRRSRRFFRMVEADYRAAVTAGPAGTVRRDGPQPRTTPSGPGVAARASTGGVAAAAMPRRGPAGRRLAGTVGALAIGVAIGWWVRERGGRRSTRP
ncbi:hypothetical protein Athai_25750 [Actinocatenispora thailandica]|uniref:Uncharacterized protein n=1 Tax=Actinocatenispora thailandica TaxID=227318 RepID=A0A7R7DPE2_9ACTN|nr:DUF6082 family protein [Actinocatenispora thailandica]BCJ35072.1 hypothetical protein Athai_25750 [Actinocatenispora thailandica]